MKVLKIVQINYCIRGQKKIINISKQIYVKHVLMRFLLVVPLSIEMNIWEFSVHILLKPTLKNFEHYFASL